jgi:formylglycine-generating enzyme required for sulfatase activity
VLVGAVQLERSVRPAAAWASTHCIHFAQPGSPEHSVVSQGQEALTQALQAADVAAVPGAPAPGAMSLWGEESNRPEELHATLAPSSDTTKLNLTDVRMASSGVLACKIHASVASPAKLRTMLRSRRSRSVAAMIACALAAQCGSGSDAPPGQVLLLIDTDAPVASQVGSTPNWASASVDTLRIELLDAQNETVEWNDVPAPDVSYWPISFGIRSRAGASAARLRLRAFRARNAELTTDPKTGAQAYEPEPAYAIDRVVEVPLPLDRGLVAYRVVLRAACRGMRPDFALATTCVDADLRAGRFRDRLGVERADAPRAHAPTWTAGGEGDCAGKTCPADAVCIPGGFFMLGNMRVVGFKSVHYHDAVPAHPVAMKGYCLDRAEVTSGALAALVNGGAVKPPAQTGAQDEVCTWAPDPSDPAKIVAAAPELPANCVSALEARKACEARGGRLPTEAEWEYAATGRGRESLFPWGDEAPGCATASLARSTKTGSDACMKSGVGPGLAADFPRDASAEVLSLGGSVSEWMHDAFFEYSKSCWARNGLLVHPVCWVPSSTTRSVRGGNWASPFEVSYAALRGSEADTGRSEQIGFRCAYALPGTEDPIEEFKRSLAAPADAGVPGDGGGR